MIYETMYEKLMQIAPAIRNKDYLKLKSPGFMDFNIDVLERNTKNNFLKLALSHYYKHPRGDLIPDPDMEVLVDLEKKTVKPLSYQDSHRYQTINEGRVIESGLSIFLNIWLTNLTQQGHQVQ